MADAPENSDEDVRIRLKQGLYEDAFELLLERYRNKIMRLAYSMIGNSAQAEDAAQDVCVCVSGARGLPIAVSLHYRHGCMPLPEIRA
jgi:hypothetical protein